MKRIDKLYRVSETYHVYKEESSEKYFLKIRYT